MTQDQSSKPVRRLNTKGKIVVGLSLCFFIAGFIVLIHSLFYAKQLQDTYTYELGSDISEDASDYIDAGFFARHLAIADFSLVDKTRPGKYPMCVIYFGKVFSYDIIIRDTIVPEITLKEGPFYFLPGTKLQPSDFIESVKDADALLNISFDTEFIEAGALSCREMREYSARIMVEDSSGNTSIAVTDYLVDDAPVISGITDFYISSGSEPDILRYVSAFDHLDGDLTDSLEITFDTEEFPENGEVGITYKVTDSCGFTTTETGTAYFDSADAIQEMICERTISRADYNIIGAYNAYDHGLFEEGDMAETLDGVMHSLVHLRVCKDDGSSTIGSGFIAEITDTDIYIVTNRHVVGNYKEADVYFIGGMCVPGANVVGCAEEYDIAVVKVSKKLLPELFDTSLTTVHIDMTYWEELDAQPIELAIEVADELGNIERIRYGSLVKKLQTFPFFEPFIETEMTLTLRAGDSGSAVFDSEGRLIAMAFAYSVAPERDWAVPLNEIVDGYKEITGRDLYTY
ncbi:MAG: trypsin-like peptidase domain-containing protein [Lachnospiraceae bacterium]|nr:trypsin-like peptidase domain-containing protein [Lachnospiraceae bacterium]